MSDLLVGLATLAVIREADLEAMADLPADLEDFLVSGFVRAMTLAGLADLAAAFFCLIMAATNWSLLRAFQLETPKRLAI